MLEDKRSWQNISHKNKKEQNGTSHWILKKKKKIFSGRAEYNKTLDPADKDKIISHVQVNKEVHRNSVQHDLDHKITAFQSKIREGSCYICSVCNRILYRKTVIQLKKQMFNTQQELFTELYTHDSFPSWNDFSLIPWNRCMPLARLELTISVY